MKHYILAGLLLLLVAGAALAQPLVYEAEALIVNKDAIVKDKLQPDKWNLWSTDNDAAKKWSGGVVLQTPVILKDRATPEEGLPPLHLLVPDLPNGIYAVELKGGRDLGISLDGKEYKRLSDLGWRLRVEVKESKLELWVDDLYADRTSPGSGYLDTITVTPVISEVGGVSNGGMEVGKDLSGSGWVFWSRDNLGAAELVSPGRSGNRALKFSYTGERDFALTNSGRLAVKPGQTFSATAWMKCEDTVDATLCIVAMGAGKLLSWQLGSDGVYGTMDWTKVDARCRIPENCDQIYLRVVGSGKASVLVDDVALTETNEPPVVIKPKTKVTGWAKTRVEEKLDRGMLAMPVEGGKVYLGWRLLKSDPASVAFNLYRGTGRMPPTRLNEKPLTKTTNFMDAKAPLDKDNQWFVKPVVNGKELAASATVSLPANPEVKGYQSIKLEGDYTFQKVGLGDLNGDGKLDYVIKQPQDNIDPYQMYWSKSPDTYKLEAYDHDGKFLWRYDLGWGIERGIWYSPCLVYDFDGDGKAEVVAKVSEGDPRGADGRVFSGPEFVAIIDGETGKEKTRLPWIDRKDFGRGLNGYNLAARNQLGLAYLDGKTPCLLVARGTYSVMKVVAYQYQKGKLQELWTWDNREETGPGKWMGQGAHWMHAGDVDGDGRDEIVLGSVTLDDDGKALWTTSLGHPDRCYLGDIDPDRPGLEIFYHIEPGQKENGVCLVDARTGEIIWGLKERTYHVGSGMAADIDPTIPGQEVWAAEDPKGAPGDDKYKGSPPKWLFSSKGEILARDEKVPSVNAVYWDADSQREIVAGRTISKYKGAAVAQNVEGGQSFWADVIGDWREELITSVKGELRIYSTTIPATDRRVCLLQDPIYRIDVANLFMGYAQVPTLGYYLAQTGPAMWMSSPSSSLVFGETAKVKLTLSASAKEASGGTVTLTCDDSITVTPQSIVMQAGPGQMAEANFEVKLKQAPALLYGGKAASVYATMPDEGPSGSVAFRIEEAPLAGVPLAQAEDFSAQSGGAVQLREDKLGSVGKSFSHWDSKDHSVSWKLNTPEAGKYWLVIRYCTPTSAARDLEIDGAAVGTTVFGGTGGFSSLTQSDWSHQCFRDKAGQRLQIQLSAGEHIVKITNTDGRGMNLDYVALVPVK
ncbi:MAG: rhamnogalacturonan lyase family protein [Armatimonadota bacterium]